MYMHTCCARDFSPVTEHSVDSTSPGLSALPHIRVTWEHSGASVVFILPQINGLRISVLANQINVKNIRGIKPKGRDNLIIVFK